MVCQAAISASTHIFIDAFVVSAIRFVRIHVLESFYSGTVPGGSSVVCRHPQVPWHRPVVQLSPLLLVLVLALVLGGSSKKHTYVEDFLEPHRIETSSVS